MKNASCEMVVTVLGITVERHPKRILFDEVSIIALQLSLLSYTGLPSETEMEVSPPHLPKEKEPIFVTESDMKMDVSLLQPKKE